MASIPTQRPTHPLVSLVAVFGLATLGGLVFGTLIGLLSRVIYLLLVFPLAIGIGEGALLAQSVRRWKLAQPRLALLAGVLMGVITYATMHYTSYLFFLNSVRPLIAQGLGVTDFARQSQIIDQQMIEHTGIPGFLGYLVFRAANGTNVGSLFSTSTTTLGMPLTVLLWLFEATVITGITAWLAWGAARDPFCPGCRQWYTSQHLGSVADARAIPFLELVRAGNFRAASAELLQDYHSTPSLEVYAQQCPTCTTSPVILTVNRATENERGTLTSQQVLQRNLMPEQSAELEHSTRPAAG